MEDRIRLLQHQDLIVTAKAVRRRQALGRRPILTRYLRRPRRWRRPNFRWVRREV
jgi:hypothetical protein